MKREQAVAVGVVLVAAVTTLALNGIVLDGSVFRGGRRGALWQPIVEGLLTGGAVLLVGQFIRTRVAAATGLLIAALLVVVDLWGLSPFFWFATSPLAWGLALALTVRLVAPRPPGADTVMDSAFR